MRLTVGGPAGCGSCELARMLSSDLMLVLIVVYLISKAVVLACFISSVTSILFFLFFPFFFPHAGIHRF
jgi:hypothetical protein